MLWKCFKIYFMIVVSLKEAFGKFISLNLNLKKEYPGYLEGYFFDLIKKYVQSCLIRGIVFHIQLYTCLT